MAEKKTTPKRTSRAKQEVMEEYGELTKELDEKRDAEMAPEEKITVKAAKKVVETADAVSTEGIINEIGKLKGETGRVLATLSERLEGEVNKEEKRRQNQEIKERDAVETKRRERERRNMNMRLTVNSSSPESSLRMKRQGLSER